jgi:hypothetical protein
MLARMAFFAAAFDHQSNMPGGTLDIQSRFKRPAPI